MATKRKPKVYVDHPTCLCCASCSHEEVGEQQFAPCRKCGEPVMSSDADVTRQLAAQRKAGGRHDAVKAQNG